MPRPGRPELTKATRAAWFVLDAAYNAGFSFQSRGAGKLEIVGPVGVDPAACEPVIDAIRAHGAEIARLVRWFADEADHGRLWSPRPEPRTRQ